LDSEFVGQFHLFIRFFGFRLHRAGSAWWQYIFCNFLCLGVIAGWIEGGSVR
jgi:hypothetical protein